MELVQGTQSISRALNVMKVIASSRRSGISSGRIVTLTKYTRPTVHRLLKVLTYEGMIRRDEKSGDYYLGPECSVFGFVEDTHYLFNEIATPILKKIAIECQDSVFLSIYTGQDVVCVIREDGDYPVKTQILQPGVRLPLGIGGGALAILSNYSDEYVANYLNNNYDNLIKNNFKIGSLSEMKKCIENSRKLGYAVNQGCIDENSWGIGVTIRTPKYQVIGSISIAAIKNRLPPERIKSLGNYLIEKKLEIEQKF